MGATTEVIHRIWQDSEGVAIDISPNSDIPNLVWLRTYGANADEYFGKLDISFSSEMARAIGKALLAAADDVERAK